MSSTTKAESAVQCLQAVRHSGDEERPIQRIAARVFTQPGVTGFTEEELRAYEKLLDNIRVERTLQQDSYEKGVAEGLEKGQTRTSLTFAKKNATGRTTRLTNYGLHWHDTRTNRKNEEPTIVVI